MKKIIILFTMLFLFVASPVNASNSEYNSFSSIQYKLEDKKDTDGGGGLVFWGMLAVAFVAISVFIIAYKSDDNDD